MNLMEWKAKTESEDGAGFPGESFARAVLEPVFLTQRDYYYQSFLTISLAHAVMLREQGILKRGEAKALIIALEEIRLRDFSSAQYDPAYEDMFFMLEKELESIVGADIAGRLHIARSRNDIGLCEFRMALRDELLRIMDAAKEFMDVLLSRAREHTDTVMPAYTHTQPAQPTTLAHYLMAFYDVLSRDMDRLAQAYHTVNQSPIGAAAITTTGFLISRERMSELLGFDALVENSYDAIAGADYLTETAGALMSLGVNLSRFLKDTLDYCAVEYGYYRLADPYVQTSSIMPQKRNPSSLEHARPLASQIIALSQAVFTMLHNTPFGDMVDSEEQLQPRLYDAFRCARRTLKLLSVNFATMSVREDVMLSRAGENFLTATELADSLVRRKGLSFRESHRIAAGVVKKLYAEGRAQSDLRVGEVREIVLAATGRDIDISPEWVKAALDPRLFVAMRGVTGGPAPGEMLRMIDARQAKSASGKTREMREKLLSAEQKLNEAVELCIKE